MRTLSASLLKVASLAIIALALTVFLACGSSSDGSDSDGAIDGTGAASEHVDDADAGDEHVDDDHDAEAEGTKRRIRIWRPLRRTRYSSSR